MLAEFEICWVTPICADFFFQNFRLGGNKRRKKCAFGCVGGLLDDLVVKKQKSL